MALLRNLVHTLFLKHVSAYFFPNHEPCNVVETDCGTKVAFMEKMFSLHF
jgi:hypothetical protein